MTDREREMELEIKFWKELCYTLLNSDDSGFISIKEASIITGLGIKRLRRHTANVNINPEVIPRSWVNWYMERMRQGFTELPSSGLYVRAPRRGR